MSLILKVL